MLENLLIDFFFKDKLIPSSGSSLYFEALLSGAYKFGTVTSSW